MATYARHLNVRQTPQSQPIPGREQDMSANNAGGFTFTITDWDRLHRFLILGSEGGTYYVGEQKLTLQNAHCVARCLKEDGPRVVATIVEISQAGRAPSNDPALFALAMASSPTYADERTRKAASLELPAVARIGTHLFTYLECCKALRGWGAGLRGAVDYWYNGKSPEQLAYQLVKYRQRGGWTHRDVLRLAHPKPETEDHNWLYKWATGKLDLSLGEQSQYQSGLALPWAFEAVQRAEQKDTILKLIRQYNLTHEMIPTQWKTDPDVWEALLEKMPTGAMLRNLANMTRYGLIAPLSNASSVVCERLVDQERLKRSRIHPIGVLAALKTYQSGHSAIRARLGFRHAEVEDRSWKPVSQVVDALDEAFYLSFGNVEPTGKRTVLALDVSGSMGTPLLGSLPMLTARDGSCAMAMVTARTEPNHVIVAFSHQMVPFEVSPRERLDDIVRKSDQLDFGGTDCALPMMWALGYNQTARSWFSRPVQYTKDRNSIIEADTFIIYTDNETWYGSIHPMQALERYRRETGIAAKLIVVGMVATEFSIADPNDAGCLDVVGFDTATPNVISNFVSGDIG